MRESISITFQFNTDLSRYWINSEYKLASLGAKWDNSKTIKTMIKMINKCNKKSFIDLLQMQDKDRLKMVISVPVVMKSHWISIADSFLNQQVMKDILAKEYLNNVNNIDSTSYKIVVQQGYNISFIITNIVASPNLEQALLARSALLKLRGE